MDRIDERAAGLLAASAMCFGSVIWLALTFGVAPDAAASSAQLADQQAVMRMLLDAQARQANRESL